jgi:hypothetical protein
MLAGDEKKKEKKKVKRAHAQPLIWQSILQAPPRNNFLWLSFSFFLYLIAPFFGCSLFHISLFCFMVGTAYGARRV